MDIAKKILVTMIIIAATEEDLEMGASLAIMIDTTHMKGTKNQRSPPQIDY